MAGNRGARGGAGYVCAAISALSCQAITLVRCRVGPGWARAAFARTCALQTTS
jgi:hypothetical protein